MTSVIGIDIGGTNIKAAVFDSSSWKILKEKTVPTNAEKGFSYVLDIACSLAEELSEGKKVPVGVCVPGPVRQPEGILLKTPNIPDSDNIAVRDLLSKKLGQDVPVENDGHCFALAEAVYGAGKGESVVCGITIGTGVGGGVIVNGKIFSGANGYAGEVGHMLLMPGKPPYTTDDMRGDAEQFFSGTAFRERCKQADTPEEYLEGQVCEFLHKDVFKEISWLCTNIIHAYDPSMIVFGGSTGKALKAHVKSIEKELANWVLPGSPLPKIAFAELQHPGAMGAAMLAL